MGGTPIDVLFIEDAELDVELAVRELERGGFEVRWTRVEDEPALRRSLESGQPHIVLSDYSMPRFDGMTALRVVRELAPGVPFIFMSGTIGEERAIESMRSGATDYILKNDMRRLAPAVQRAVSDAGDRAQAALVAAERARLAAILEATSDFVAVYDETGASIYANAAARALIGYGGGMDAGNVLAGHPDWARDIVRDEAWPAAERDGIWQGETAMLGQDGGEIPVSQVIIAHRDDGGRVQYFSTIARDIRDRKAYEHRIAHLANFDALTDLPNRALLADRLAQATAYLRRTDRYLALLVIDVDHFKLINDGFGQAAGDEALRLVAARLIEAIRDGDTVARLGADTFAVLAVNLAGADDVLDVVHKVQARMQAPFDIASRSTRLTVSMGASVFPRDGKDFASLLRNADTAMHRAQAGGEGGFEFYATEMTRDATERVELEQALRGAIERGELAMHYQPLLHLADGRIIGFEALMRWNHPQHGWIPPDRFIPIAEHTDLIITLGNWALETACRELRRWDDGRLHLAVNVSARQFRDPAFVQAVGRVLEKTGVEPSRLVLEITEGVLVESLSEVAAHLDLLKAIGVQVAIDDFGTGYSSLSYLSRLPIDCLKIDRAFVQRQATDPHDAEIVRAIISLGSSLGMRVVAEGVETREQCTFLLSHGCTQGQGYLFSKPVAPDGVAALIARGTL